MNISRCYSEIMILAGKKKKRIKYTYQIYNEMKSSKKIQEKPERRVPVEYIPKAR